MGSVRQPSAFDVCRNRNEGRGVVRGFGTEFHVSQSSCQGSGFCKTNSQVSLRVMHACRQPRLTFALNSAGEYIAVDSAIRSQVVRIVRLRTSRSQHIQYLGAYMRLIVATVAVLLSTTAVAAPTAVGRSIDGRPLRARHTIMYTFRKANT